MVLGETFKIMKSKHANGIPHTHNYREQAFLNAQRLNLVFEGDFFTEAKVWVRDFNFLLGTPTAKNLIAKWRKAEQFKGRPLAEVFPYSQIFLPTINHAETMLLALQNELLRIFIDRIRKTHPDIPTKEERAASEERNPITRKALSAAASKLKEEARDHFVSASGQPEKTSQDYTPERPFFFLWYLWKREMSVYDMCRATAVSRRTIKLFLRKRKFVPIKRKGRLSIYGENACIKLLVEWLSNRKWHRQQENQKYFTMEVLFRAAESDSQLFRKYQTALKAIITRLRSRDSEFDIFFPQCLDLAQRADAAYV